MLWSMRAQRLTLSLHVERTGAVLLTQDDGAGFHMPASLSTFAYHDHYGIIGIAERV